MIAMTTWATIVDRLCSCVDYHFSSVTCNKICKILEFAFMIIIIIMVQSNDCL